VVDQDTLELGLRERKKTATREALAWAAIRLAVERGPENVRVEDIATAVGVSKRTYNNYFSTKEEGMCAFVISRGASIRAALLERPAKEPLGEAVLAAFLAQYASPTPDRESVRRLRMVTSSPALRGEYLKAMAVTEQYLAQAIARRSGRRDQDLFPRVLAASIISAARVGVEHWVATRSGDFAAVVGHALKQVLAQVQPPPSRPRSRRGRFVERAAKRNSGSFERKRT